MEQDFYKNKGDVKAYIEFEMLTVKVPVMFLGTVDKVGKRFSAIFAI